MARGINTKCLHLERRGRLLLTIMALSALIYQTTTYEHPAVGRVQALTTADCRTRPESIWKNW